MLAPGNSDWRHRWESICDARHAEAGAAIGVLLFVAQCNNRIYGRGAPGGKVRRGGRNSQH